MRSARRFVCFLSLAALAVGLVRVSARAATPVEYAAQRLGYQVVDDGAGGSVLLSRPGVTVVLRPGNHLYTVNGRVESISPAPQMHGGMLYVPAALLAELRRIAAATPLPSRLVMQRMPTPQFSGKLMLNLAQIPGQNALKASGTGPADAPLRFSLTATLSRDLPVVFLGDARGRVGADGRFSTTLELAPAWLPGTAVTLTVRSTPGVALARRSFVLAPPNPDVVSPLDTLSSQ